MLIDLFTYIYVDVPIFGASSIPLLYDWVHNDIVGDIVILVRFKSPQRHILKKSYTLGDQLFFPTKNMHTMTQGTISYMCMCDYFRYNSNNQKTTHKVNEQSTYHLDGHQLGGVDYAALIPT